MAGWWLPQLNPKGLSQGDIIRPLISGTAAVPWRPLRPQALKGNKPGWAETAWTPENSGDGHYLARGKVLPCLVVSYSCDLDKDKSNARVLVVPMQPLTALTEESREAVLQLLSINLFPLVQVPNLEDHCADLRCISHVNRKLVNDCERVASMTDLGMQNLEAHLVYFFTRLPVPANQFTKVG
ncbi:MAG TPA: hypothetical protein VIW95_05690 [Candidatus Binatus sp.]|uniref:hypothetical protein n=1 Tax=Candidatus Binatus sp. TaxID=2811406 RepID=UPI002F411603